MKGNQIANTGTIVGGPTLEELKSAGLSKTLISFKLDPGTIEVPVKIISLTDLQRPGVDRWKVMAEMVIEEAAATIILYYNLKEKAGLYTFD